MMEKIIIDFVYLFFFVAFPILMGVSTIITKRKCSKRIRGTYCGYKKCEDRFDETYYPFFSYTLSGRKYEKNMSSLGLTYEEIQRFENERYYTIYVNPDSPDEYTIREEIPAGAYIDIVIGIICAIVFCYLMKIGWPNWN